MSLFLKHLAARRAPPPDPQADLRQRVQRWYASLPPISRQRPFSMTELRQGTGIPARFLGQILADLGWTRHRQWHHRTNYYRYWLPPGK